MNQKPILECESKGTINENHKRWCSLHSGLCWSAIFAGALIALGISFLLDLFSMGIGLSAYTASTTTEAKVFAFGGYIALVLAGMIAMFSGGWVSGFIGRPACSTGCHGIIYGLVTWSLALILSIMLMSSVGEFLTVQYDVLTKNNTYAGFAKENHSPSLGATYNSLTSSDKNNTSAPANKEEAIKNTTKGIFLLFLIFISGALSAAFGGYTAVKRCKYDYPNDHKEKV